MKKIFLLILLLSLFGCTYEASDKYEVTPKSLPVLPVTINYQDFDLPVQKQFKQRIEYIKLLKKNKIEKSKLSWAIGQLCKTYQAYLINDEARDCYINAIFYQPNNYKWHYLLAHVYKQMGLFDNSAIHYHNAIDIKNYIPAKIWLADVLIQQNKWQEAKTINLKVLKTNPNHVLALYNLAIIEQHFKNQKLAIEYLTKALEQQPQAYQLNYQLGIIYSKLKQETKAQNYFQKIPSDTDLKVSMTFSDPHMHEISKLRRGVQSIIKKAMKASKQGYNNLAIQLFNEALKADPNKIDTVYNLAVAYVKTNNLNHAKYLLHSIVEHEDAKVYSLMASINRAQKEYSMSNINLQKALSIQPEETLYLNQMGDLLVETKQHLLAIDYYQKSIGLNSHQELVKLKLARVYLQQDKINEIKQLFKNSTFLPKYEITKLNILSRIDYIHYIENNTYNLSNDNYMSLETLAMIAAHNKDFDKAIIHQNDAFEYAKTKKDISRIKDRLESYRKHQPPQSLWNIDEPLVIN